MTSCTGKERIAEALARVGIKHVFTTSTARMAPLIAALEEHPNLNVIRARSEIAAAAMADGYIRRSHRLAAVVTDDNGAALSQLSAVTNAWADKVPVISLALCSDAPPDPNKGLDRFRFDQTRVFQAVTLWRNRLNRLADLPETLNEAVHAALGLQMGPAHLDIPFGMLDETVSVETPAPVSTEEFTEREVIPARLAGDETSIHAAVDVIAGARRPLLFVGNGLKKSGGVELLRQFAERFEIPVATSMAGIGAFPMDHPLSLGGPSYAAGETFHAAIREADVVIAVGAGFSGLDGFGLPPIWSKNIRFIHIDCAPLRIGLNVSPEVAILGDARTVLEQLTADLAKRNFSGQANWKRWRKYLARLKKGRMKRLDRDANKRWPKMHQGRIVQEFARMARMDDKVIVIDGGNTPLYAAMYAPSPGPDQAFFPFGMAALGGGIPYAIGVQLAAPDQRVILFTGDGSLLYNIQELETIRRLNLPIIIVVNNDSSWNMIRAMQESFFARNYIGTDLPDCGYACIAKGFGLAGERVETIEDLRSAYLQAVESGRPTLIDAITDARNLPDSLLSFSLVEFEGSLGQLSLPRFLKSLWLMRDLGLHRNLHMLAYVRKALLGFNPLAKWRI